ncbi:hypothetical protein DA2_3458 [Desulfovibrio sp. A2]|nr:hypothetical protein DA2_3458 [Desulfovibrio sp. A2]
MHDLICLKSATNTLLSAKLFIRELTITDVSTRSTSTIALPIALISISVSIPKTTEHIVSG